MLSMMSCSFSPLPSRMPTVRLRLRSPAAVLPQPQQTAPNTSALALQSSVSTCAAGAHIRALLTSRRLFTGTPKQYTESLQVSLSDKARVLSCTKASPVLWLSAQQVNRGLIIRVIGLMQYRVLNVCMFGSTLISLLQITMEPAGLRRHVTRKSRGTGLMWTG